jgi:hypothetical protein
MVSVIPAVSETMREFTQVFSLLARGKQEKS